MDKSVFQRWLDSMSYLDLTITDLHQALIEGKVTPLELAKEAIKRAKEDNNNAFEYISEKEALEAVALLKDKDKNNLMWGIPFVIKDNFSTKDMPTTGSSNMLIGYKPPFSSEVYKRLLNSGGIPIGKTTLDEIAMGGSGMTGHLGYTYNPYDPSHNLIVGGSSCGSASAIAASIAPFGIGSDTGDSVRKPASYAGLVGFKPTWGRISRYGLFPFATSLDHVAYFTRSVEDSALTLGLLAGFDNKDSSSSQEPVKDYFKSLNPCISGLKIAIIKEIYDVISDKNIRASFEKTIERLKEKGAVINYVSLDKKLCDAIFPTYFILSCAESTSNNAYLDGIKFGSHVDGEDYKEIMKKTRTNGFSERIKKRFIIGSFSLLSENQEDMFLRAQKCRRLIVDAINNILKDNDVIYLPASPTTAPRFDRKAPSLFDSYFVAENYLAFANFAGLPSLTLPLGKIDGMPFGGNITGRAFDEQTVFNISLAIEEITGLKNLSARKENE